MSEIIKDTTDSRQEAPEIQEIDILTRLPVTEVLGMRAMEGFEARQRILYPEFFVEP